MLKPICKKCGSYDINLEYVDTYERVLQRVSLYGEVSHHIEIVAGHTNCTCSRCGYKWVEEPLDKYDNVVNKCIKKN